MRKTTKTERYAKIAASAVVVLLFGLVTSTALADDSPFSALPSDSPFSALAGDNGFSALDALTGSTSTSTITTPTVSSDKGDYAPGELVTLRGTNWHPGEAVHIYVNDDQGRTWDRDSDVVADQDGVIVDSFNLPNWFVATYAVIATGASSGTATAAFTDANPQSVQIAPGSLTVAPGSSAVYTVSVPITGNDGLCTLDLSASGLPAGATATFGSTSLTGNKGDSPSTSLTVATTGVTPAGTTTFTVTAARRSNCQGSGDLTGTANLVVAKSVGAVAVGAQTGALTAGTAGSATYSVTVNRNGATGTAFTASLSANGLPAGATASFNPSSVSFASSDASKTSTMTIATTSAAAAGSTPFTVRATNPNATGDFSDGNENLVVGAACTAASVTTQPSNQSITYGANATFTAAGAGNPAPSVQWQASTNGGSSWTNVSGATATSLTITKPGVSQNGNQFRAVFTNTCDGTKTATSNAATLNVAAKAITITPDSGQSKVYGASDPTLTYTTNAGLESGDGFTGALARAAGENAGSYAITLGGLSAGQNYNLSLAATPVNFTITAKQVTITPDDGQSKLYGASDPALTFTNDSGLTASTFTGALDRAAGENAGTYGITLGNLSAGSNYAISLSSPPATFEITKKPITVKADDKTKVYGSADPALTVTVPAGALESGDSLSGELERAAGKDVGSYAITKGTLTAGGNYDLTVTPGTLTITKKAITVKAEDKTKVYGSADPALTVTVPAGALESGDSLSGELERAAGKDVGSYAITKGTLTAGGNYDLTVTPGTFTITKKAATLTAVDKSKVYGSADPALTTTDGGFLADDLGAGKISFSASRAAGESVAGGPYTITPAATDAATSLLDNYDVTYNNGKLTITKKAATLTAVDKSKVYGSADPALTTTDGGFLADDLGAGKISFSTSRAAGESVAGGPYTITPAATDAATSLLGNYDVTYNNGQLTITKKAITGSFVAAGKVYDGNTEAVVNSRDLTGLVGDDVVSLVGGSAAFDTKNAGSDKTVTLTGATLFGADAGNYTLESVVTSKADITPKPITVKADDKTKVYGSADPALTVTVPAGALESGDSLSGNLERAAGKDVGSYAITKGTLTAGGNYDLTVTPGTLTITKKAITVKAEDKTKVYGSTDPALSVTVPAGALESGDSLSGELERAAGNDVGSYQITKGTLTAGGNYDLTVTPGTLTITKKAITVTADPQTKVIGAADPALTYKVPSGSLESADSFSGALTRATGEAIGAYAITQGTLTAGGNYDLTFAGSTLKIVYGWGGFLQPINDTAHQTGVQQSKFKLGQTIPAKFLLRNAAGAVVRQATDPTFSRSGNLGACDATAAADTTDVVTPDAGVTYAWDGSQYHYNWSTKGLTGGEYRIYANLADGTKQYVDICLAK